MTGWEREWERDGFHSTVVSTWSTSLDRPETALLLSVRDQHRLRLHVHMPGWNLPVNLSSPAPGHHTPGYSGCQAATISTMMTTIIAQSSWPEVCGRRNLRTRCAAATRNPALARFLRLLAKKRSRHQRKPATGGFPSGLSGLPSVRGVSQHTGSAVRWLTDDRLASHWQPGVCPRKKPERCTARAQPPGNEGVLHLC